MKCREIEAHLCAYLAEETSSGLRRSIKAHLKGCKKCRARMEGLNRAKEAPNREPEAASLPPEPAPSPHPPSVPSAEAAEMSWILWPHPVGMTVTIVLIGGIFLLSQWGLSDLKGDARRSHAGSAVAEEVPSSSPDEGGPGTQEGKAPLASPPPPAEAPQTAAQAVSKRQTIPPPPPLIKLLLISRDIHEAAETVSSQGKVLSKKRDELAAKVVLLVPAERYQTFSRSLHSLGLVRALSENEPPSEGSLKVEVTIE